MKEVRLALAGLGQVVREFLELVIEKEAELAEEYGLKVLVTAAASPSRGCLVDPDGLDPRRLAEACRSRQAFAPNRPEFRPWDTGEMIAQAPADVLIELSTLNVLTGQPATSYIEQALTRGLDVITANKGPVACHYQRLRDLADRLGRGFYHEGVVMDGTPVFNLARLCLNGCRVLGLRGVLNGTSNYVLTCMELGVKPEKALAEARSLGRAEADAHADMGGWDGAAKITALANVLMGAGLTPAAAEVRGVEELTIDQVRKARREGRPYKLICTAILTDQGRIKLRVGPEQLASSDPLATVDGFSAALTLYTDLGGQMTIFQTDPVLLQTAWAVYSDLLIWARERG